MKRKLLSLLVLVFCISAIGQDSKVEIENLNEEICNLKNEVSSYKRQFTNQNVKVNSIERKQDESIKDIESLKKEVITIYDSLEESKKTLHEEISSTKEKLCDNKYCSNKNNYGYYTIYYYNHTFCDCCNYIEKKDFKQYLNNGANTYSSRKIARSTEKT